MHQRSKKAGLDAGDAIVISLSDSTRPKHDKMLDGRLLVRSPHGLKPQDRLLLEAADNLPASHILTLATSQTVLALAPAALRPEASVTFYHYDLFHVLQAESQAGGHRLLNVEAVCAPEIPPLAEAPELILAEFSATGEAGLTIELIHQAHDCLARGGKMLSVINNAGDKWLRHQLEKTFGNLTQVVRDKHSIVYLVKRTAHPAEAEGGFPPEKIRFIKHVNVHFAPWDLEFETCYGTFNSETLDEGSRALLDVLTPPESCRAVLDLGCGWGGMGILAAKKAGAEKLFMIDSNARAVEMARRNAVRHGPASAEVVLESEAESIQSGAHNGQFDLVVSNPPYGTEFRVLDMFITMAWRALRPGGQVYVVGKNNARMIRKMEEVFGEAEELRRRGYSVVKATRQDTRKY